MIDTSIVPGRIAPSQAANQRALGSDAPWPSGPDWRWPAYPHGPGPDISVPRHRIRNFRGIVVVRPYGPWYPGYGFYRTDEEAYRWLGLTAITLVLLDQLNESQERALEAAQIQATTAPIGQTIAWNAADASGSVVALREGYANRGAYCREFQQSVTIAGRQEEVYGAACKQPDGAWQVVATRSNLAS